MVGTVLGVRYELTQSLEGGPVFDTYAAHDLLQNRDVCVRLLKSPFNTDVALIAQLRDVVQRYGGIDHHGIERMMEVDEDEKSPYLLSELTIGTPLAERIRKLAPFSVPVAVSTAISLCEGLEALHRSGLPHGDVSALTACALPDGQVRLQLPGMWQAYSASPMAAGLMLPLMAPYLSPEISAGGMPSPVGDVYATGVILYELLTGRLPYNADTPVSMALKHATGTVPTVRMYNPSVPQVLDEIVKKALSKDPATRYGSAGALLSDLRVLQDALRFGRTVTWPITPETDVINSPAMPKRSSLEKQPRMGTTRPSARERDRERDRGDVPMFLVVLLAVFGAVVATMLGIWIYFNVSAPHLLKVPALNGLTLTEARDLVKTSKLLVEVEGEKTDEHVPADHIISSDPGSGERIREGGVIRVLVSTGSRFVPVPDLKGNSVDQARSILKGVHLELDDNIDQQGSSKIDAGLIISQSPASGKKVLQTSKVKIVVSTGPDGGTDTGGGDRPISSGETRLYTLEVKLNGLDKPVTLRVDMEDDRGTRTVYEQEHEPNETVVLPVRGTGKEVTFLIYYDNELVKTVKQTADAAEPIAPGEDGGQ